MNQVQYLEVDTETTGQRLDNFLIRVLKGVPKTYIYRIIREGQVRVDKKRAKPSTRLEAGLMIRIPPIRMSVKEGRTADQSVSQRLLQSIIYEDAGLIVLNKPIGVAVHGGSGVSFGVIETLRQNRPDLVYIELIHRLDRETSGCLLLAKKRSVLRAIQALFEKREVHKCYWALLQGHWEGSPKQIVSAPLLKNIQQSGERMVFVDEQGKPSRTCFNLLANASEYALVAAYPETGRTHQIRVHSAHLGHPIVGDVKYTKQSANILPSQALLPRLYLHARAIQFTLGEQSYHFEAPLDDRFVGALHQLGWDHVITDE